MKLQSLIDPGGRKIKAERKRVRQRSLVLLPLLASCLLFPSIVIAGVFGVSPIRLDFEKDIKSGVITVRNEGEEKLTVQMKAFEWTQDAEGKDVYSDTGEIIFFPTIASVGPKEERIIRAGIRVPAAAREKTYRLFIEEIPGPREGGGAQVAVAIRFGVPIFGRPLRVDAKGEIDRIQLSKGVVSVSVRNTGNVHFRITSVRIKGTSAGGEEIFAKELDGWYLLNAASRTYTASVAEPSCREAARLDVEVKTDQFDLSGKLDVDQAMCLP